jgi:hypothetical protein
MIATEEITMSGVADKLRDIEIELSSKHGPFALFALIERDDAFGKWDVLVSANWMPVNAKSVIEAIASKIKTVFREEELIMLSRILILAPSDSFVQNLNLIPVEHGMVRLTNNSFNGVSIKEAFLITSMRDSQ